MLNPGDIAVTRWRLRLMSSITIDHVDRAWYVNDPISYSGHVGGNEPVMVVAVTQYMTSDLVKDGYQQVRAFYLLSAETMGWIGSLGVMRCEDAA